MKAQNELGRNTQEFVKWMNERTNALPCAMRQVFFDAWKEGFEPSAVWEYLTSEIYMARVEFGMKMTAMQGKLGDKLKDYDKFDVAYNDYRKERDKRMSEARNVENLPKL